MRGAAEGTRLAGSQVCSPMVRRRLPCWSAAVADGGVSVGASAVGALPTATPWGGLWVAAPRGEDGEEGEGQVRAAPGPGRRGAVGCVVGCRAAGRQAAGRCALGRPRGRRTERE